MVQLKAFNEQYRELERQIADTELRLIGLPEKNKNKETRVLESKYISELHTLR